LFASSYFIFLSSVDKVKNKVMKYTFGNRIRLMRKNSNLSLTELALLLKLDCGNLSKIERGKRVFDEKKLNKLAKIFNTDIEQLKIEYYGEIFAKKIVEYSCPSEALLIAEKKVKQIASSKKSKNEKQADVN